MKDKLNKIVPSYSWKMLIAVVCINCITYFGTKPITGGRHHYILQFPLESAIPFRPEWVTVYFLAYVFWGLGFILVARESERACKVYFTGEIIAKLICFLCFVLLPTTIVRPNIGMEGSVWQKMTYLLYQVDSPDNLFPSIHCLESWFCCRTALKLRKAPSWYPVFAWSAAFLVFASTLLLKQHVFVDVIGGVLVLEIGFFISGRIYSRKENLDL